MKWISVDKDTPNYGFEVIVADKHGNVSTAWYAKDSESFEDCNRVSYKDITHWMPLPKPPQNQDWNMLDETTIRRIFREELALAVQTKEPPRMVTTEEIMIRFNIKSKSTLNNYQKMGMPYFKGKPNLYNLEEVIKFFTDNMIRC